MTVNNKKNNSTQNNDTKDSEKTSSKDGSELHKSLESKSSVNDSSKTLRLARLSQKPKKTLTLRQPNIETKEDQQPVTEKDTTKTIKLSLDSKAKQEETALGYLGLGKQKPQAPTVSFSSSSQGSTTQSSSETQKLDNPAMEKSVTVKPKLRLQGRTKVVPTVEKTSSDPHPPPIPEKIPSQITPSPGIFYTLISIGTVSALVAALWNILKQVLSGFQVVG